MIWWKYKKKEGTETYKMNLNLKRPTICYLICFFLLISSSLQKNLNHKRDVSYEIDEQQPQTEYKYYVQEEENNQLPRDLQQKYASDDVMSFTVQPKSSATNNNNQLENVTVKVGQQAVMPCFVNNLGSFKVIYLFIWPCFFVCVCACILIKINNIGSLSLSNLITEWINLN